MDVRMSSLIAYWILCLPIFGEALLPISLWDGLVPSIVVEKGYAGFAPAFHGGFDGSKSLVRTVPSVLGQMVGSDELPLLKTYPQVEGMSEDERQLLSQGQALKDQIISLRTKIALNPVPQVMMQEESLLEELKLIHKKLEGLNQQLTTRTQPILAGAITNLHNAMQPLDSIVCENRKGNIFTSLIALIFTPSLSAALKGVQVLAGLLGAIDIVRAARAIKAACDAHDYDMLRKAQLHMLRAEGRLVSAGADLDRITSDSIAERPIQRCDLDRFGIGQRDTAVQLANVRHSLKALRGGDAEQDARLHSANARGWFALGLACAGASQTLPVAPSPLGPIAAYTAMFAAAFHAVLAGIQGHLAGSVDGVQRRHDAALAEHEGLQAQYEELPCSEPATSTTGTNVATAAAAPISPARAVVSPPRKKVAWEDADETGVSTADDCVSPERQRQRVLDALRELIRDVKRPETQPLRGSAAGLSVPSVGKEQGAGTTFGGDDDADGLGVNHARRAATIPQESPAPPVVDGGASRREEHAAAAGAGAPARLLASSWRPCAERGETPRPSGLRQPTATPPPPLRGYKTSRHSLTPGPVFRSSLTPGPPTSRWTSMPPGSGYGQTPPPHRESSQPCTPRSAARSARRSITPAPTSHRFTPAPAGLSRGSTNEPDGGPLELPEQLLEALAHRIEAHSVESERRCELEAIFGQLREATRAARQQARASEKTAAVLRECVDEGLAQKILAAQEEAARRTREALRDCVAASVRALEAEARACGLASNQRAGEEETSRRRLCATLEQARHPMPQRPPSGAPLGRAASPSTGGGGPMGRAVSPPIIGGSMRRATSPPTTGGAGGVAWSSFVERQAGQADRRRSMPPHALGGGAGGSSKGAAREGSSVTPESPTPDAGVRAGSARVG